MFSKLNGYKADGWVHNQRSGNRSSRSQMFFNIDFIKKRHQHRRFSVNIAKFLRTSFFTELLRWLLLL